MTSRKKQPDLPGVERKIDELQSKAIEYAEIRDKRQSLLQKEVDMKNDLLQLMKKNKIEKYKYENVSIEIVHDDEHVRVRINKSSEED